MWRTGLTASLGLALLGAIILIRPTPREYRRPPAHVAVLLHEDAPFKKAPPTCASPAPLPSPAIEEASFSETEPDPNPGGDPAWVFVNVVAPVGCLETEFEVSLESIATETQVSFHRWVVTTRFSAMEVPAHRDYDIFAQCHENAGEGMVRRLAGQATVSHVLGSAVVFLELIEREVFEDRT